MLYSLTVDVELARQQWKDGQRRLDETRRADAQRFAGIARQVDLVVAALRRRVGQTFTLSELAETYGGADNWVRELLDDEDPEGAPAVEAGTVADAAFESYARGATDYRP
ncbi:MAG TPA: hypothetical protein VLK36_05945 [Gaiellaceae bacterium]|nr:hypothetical protein [Gaiellaceae bacterium]